MVKISAAAAIIKPSYLLAVAGISCLICLNGLRTNNLMMVHLRADVYQADKDNGDVRGKLTTLQHYVNAHMNTNLSPRNTSVYPPIQLKYTYDRLQAAANAGTNNEQVYADAQTHCEALNRTDFSGRNRVPCIQAYVSSHGAVTPKAIPDSLYKFDFASPSWSPDVAGWSMTLTVLLLISALVLWIMRKLGVGGLVKRR